MQDIGKQKKNRECEKIKKRNEIYFFLFLLHSILNVTMVWPHKLCLVVIQALF